MDVEVLGKAAPLLAITGTIVTPVVGFIQNCSSSKDVEELTKYASENEVASIFTLTIPQLMDEDQRGVEDINRGPMIPYFSAGPSRIWGKEIFII